MSKLSNMENRCQNTLDRTLAFLDTALEMRDDMTDSTTPNRHFLHTKSIIIGKVDQLCMQVHDVCNGQPQLEDYDVICVLQRMSRIKSGILAIAELGCAVNWAAFNQAMTAGFQFLDIYDAA